MSSSSLSVVAPPPTMSQAEQARIRLIAAYVVSSVNPSKFQLEFTQATKNNLNFDFLRPDHPHNAFYQYNIQIWQSKSSTQKAQAHLQQEKVEQNFQQQNQNNNNGNQNYHQLAMMASGGSNSNNHQQPFFGDNYGTSVFSSAPSSNYNNNNINNANQTGGVMNFL